MGTYSARRARLPLSNTGAFMGNFIGRFAFGKFQPYAGGGVGVYYAESAGLDFSGPNGNFSTSGGKNHADFAWQIIAGTDYYWTLSSVLLSNTITLTIPALRSIRAATAIWASI